MKYNSILSTIEPSASMKAGLGVNKSDYVNLAIGIPDIETPLEIKNVLTEISKENNYNYIPTRGTKNALNNLIEVVLNNDVKITEENISLVSGAKFGVFLSLKTVTNPGDTVILVEPYWLSYPDICKILGLNIVVWKPKIINNNLIYDFDELENIISSESPIGIIINQPNNPAGTNFKEDEVSQITESFKKINGFVLFDEVYKDFMYYNNPIYDFDYSTIIRVGSLSKSLSLTGLRVGYVVGNMEFISAFTLFNQHISTCTNSLSNAILERITKPCFNKHIAILKDVYRQRYELLKDKLKDTELGLIESQGTFYALIDFSAFFYTGEAAVNFLRDELNTLTTSGSHYGKTFEKYVRICLSVDENCLSEFVNRLTDKLLK